MNTEENKINDTIFFEKTEVDGHIRSVARINYLELLNTRKETSKSEIKKLKDILGETDEPENHVITLLDVRNWRPHLIGCLAALFIKEKQEVINALWRAFDKASWVAPQIVATLSILDKNFEENSLIRLDKGVLIFEPNQWLIDLNKTRDIRNPKGFMSLWGLLETCFDCPELKKKELEEMKLNSQAKDRDNSVAIALGWRKEVLDMLNILSHE